MSQDSWLRKSIKENPKGWLYHPDVAPQEANDQYAHILFLRTEQGVEWLCDAAIYTLPALYHYELHEEATWRLRALLPAWQGWEEHEQLPKALQAKAEHLYEEILAELLEEGSIKVCETIDVQRDEVNLYEQIDVYLNRACIGEDVISWFVTHYCQRSLNLASDCYSFEEEY